MTTKKKLKRQHRYNNQMNGKKGIVVIISKGKPRNHAVDVNGVVVVVPCGNLQSPNQVTLGVQNENRR